MTTTADETLDAIDDRFFTAEDPPEPRASPAGDGRPPPSPDAPYGWTKDAQTHEWRPKKSPGRGGKPPPAPEDVAAAPPVTPADDAPPPPPGRGRHRPPAPPAEEVPMPKGGVIAKGVNRLYRRGGKYLRILDDEIGLAVIECTRPDPEDPEAPTVGEAWENLARENPRIRAWLVKAIAGGAWQELIFAHAAIAFALFTRDWVRRWIPGATLERAMAVVLEEDEDSLPGDLTPEDAQEMQRTAEAEAQRIASRMGIKVPANVAAAAMRQAEAEHARQTAPEAFRRQQPTKGASRAKRRGR